MSASRRRYGSVRRLPSGRWQVRYRDRAGVQHTAPSTFATKTDAAQWLSRVETDLHRGEWVNPERGRVTFGAWADDWLAAKIDLRPKTEAGYRSVLNAHLRPRFGAVPVAEIDALSIRRFVADLSRSGAGPGTVRNVFRVLSLVLGAAVDVGAIRANPCAGASLPKSMGSEAEFLTAEQVNDLARAIDARYRVLVLLAAYTGLRAGEVAGLRVGRVDLMRRTLDVQETLGEVDGHLVAGPTKTRQRRQVPVPGFLADALAVHMAEVATDPEAYVFTADRGGPLRHGNFYRRHFKPAVARAGLPPAVRFHDLRHTCAALLISQGAHPKAVADLLGHSSITVTLDRYGHLFPSIAEGLASSLDAAYRAAQSTTEPSALLRKIG